MSARFFLCWFILLSVGTCPGATETYFEVIDQEENSIFGTITALDRTQIVIDVRGTSVTLPLEKLIRIRNLALNPYEDIVSVPAGYHNLPPPPTRNSTQRQRIETLVKKLQSSGQTVKKTFPNNTIALELKDGSLLTVSSFTVADNQGVCRLLDQQNDVTLPLNNIAAVRLSVRNLLEVLNPPTDWIRLAVPSTTGDQLVVGNPGSFDVYAGILNNVSAETIAFNVEGEVLPVPRRKVFGLVLHNDSASVSTPPFATLMHWTGTKGMITDISLNENELTWKTSSGLTVTTPLNMISEIDFGEKKIAYLTDFEQTRNEFSLPFASNVNPAQFKLLQTFYEGRAKNSSREVVLDGIEYSRGVTLMGKTSLEYRLPKPFAVLKAVVGIEDQFRPYTSANLQILADSQVLGTWELRGDLPSQRIHLNLPQNCRLITIIAEPVPQSNTPTVLTVAEPKLFE